MLNIKHIKKVLIFIMIVIIVYTFGISSFLLNSDENNNDSHNQIASAFISVKSYDEQLENSFKYWILDTKTRLGLLP